jgi:hypothetical protein
MSIVIPPQLEATLARQARLLGVLLQDYVEGIRAKEVCAAAALTKDDLERILANDTPELRATRAAAIDRLREVRKGVTLGPGLTVRDLIDEGRRL